MTLAARLWAKVDKSGDCWIWQGARLPKGYGKIIANQRIVYAHRAVWELTYGPIPPAQFVLHRCDQPSCVRPDHLFLGSAADNSADMKAKGRAPTGAQTRYSLDPESTRGERNPRAKLTPKSVLAMRELRLAGASYAEIGRRFGISKSAAHLVITGQTWRHVDLPGLCESKPN